MLLSADQRSPAFAPHRRRKGFADRPPLIDIDALGLVARSLGDHDAEDPILQARLDRILVHARGEAERAMELANRALRDPVLGTTNLPLSFPLRSNNLPSPSLLPLVFFVVLHSRFMALPRIRHVTRDASVGFIGPFGGILALGAAFDDQRMRVGELDVHVFLLDAGQLALELVGGLVFAYVEFGLEGADGGVGG